MKRCHVHDADVCMKRCHVYDADVCMKQYHVHGADVCMKQCHVHDADAVPRLQCHVHDADAVPRLQSGGDCCLQRSLAEDTSNAFISPSTSTCPTSRRGQYVTTSPSPDGASGRINSLWMKPQTWSLTQLVRDVDVSSSREFVRRI